VVAKALVGCTREGGVLKTGLQVRREADRQLARKSRDSRRIHVDLSCTSAQEERLQRVTGWSRMYIQTALRHHREGSWSGRGPAARQECAEEGIAGLHQKVSRPRTSPAPNAGQTTTAPTLSRDPKKTLVRSSDNPPP
jgi:hypothetical protein